jgi:hypothetical protein
VQDVLDVCGMPQAEGLALLYELARQNVIAFDRRG